LIENEKLQHSKYGIASFVVGIIHGVLFILDPMNYFDSLIDFSIPSPQNTLFPPVLGIIGVILGVVGMRQRDKNRIFAKLGFWFNLIPMILTIGLILLVIGGGISQ